MDNEKRVTLASIGEIEYEDEWLTFRDIDVYKGIVEAHRVE